MKSPFKKELCTNNHLWHATLADNRGKFVCYFNWRLERFDIGFELNIGRHGVDFTFSFWATLSGYFIWRKIEVEKSVYDHEDY